MLHTKFQSHRPFGSREEDIILRFLPYMGMAVNLVMGPRPFEQTPISRRFYMKFGFNRPSGFREDV